MVSLGRREEKPPAELLEQAVIRFLQEKKERIQARNGLQESFGVWKERSDLKPDSTVIIDTMRGEWDEREQRLGLA